MQANFTTDVVIQVFVQTVKFLLEADQKTQTNICVWSNHQQYANFKKSSFDIACMRKASTALYSTKKLALNEYRQLLNIFREMGWLVCQEGRYTNI